jgi:hypothetical protein
MTAGEHYSAAMKSTSTRAAQRWDERQFFGMKLWLPGSVILFAALVAYCEVCTVLAALPRGGIAASSTWALQITVGWAFIGAFFATYGARITDARLVRAWPLASGTLAVLAIAGFALICETVMAWLSGDSPELLSLVTVRGPMTLAGSALAVVTFGLRRFAAPRRIASLQVMTGTGYVSIATADIECLEADGNYLNVAHVSGRTYLLRSTMQAAERRLGCQFVRVHRSVIVNRARIRERRRGGQLVLQSGRIVRIGRAFRSRLS